MPNRWPERLVYPMYGNKLLFALLNPQPAFLFALPFASQGGYDYFPVLYIAAGAAAFYAIKRASELSAAHHGLVFAYVPDMTGATMPEVLHGLTRPQLENRAVRASNQNPPHSGIGLRRKAVIRLLYERRIMYPDQNPVCGNARPDESVFWEFGANLRKASASARPRRPNAEVMCFSGGEARVLSSALYAFSPEGAKALLLKSCGYLVVTYVPIRE